MHRNILKLLFILGSFLVISETLETCNVPANEEVSCKAAAEARAGNGYIEYRVKGLPGIPVCDVKGQLSGDAWLDKKNGFEMEKAVYIYLPYWATEKAAYPEIRCLSETPVTVSWDYKVSG